MNSALASLIKDLPIPPMARVAQTFADDQITDVAGAVTRAMASSIPVARLPHRGRLAGAVGSRGIARLPAIVRAVAAGAASFGAAAAGGAAGVMSGMD